MSPGVLFYLEFLASEVYENIIPVTRPDNLKQLPDLTGADTRIILPNISMIFNEENSSFS